MREHLLNLLYYLTILKQLLHYFFLNLSEFVRMMLPKYNVTKR